MPQLPTSTIFISTSFAHRLPPTLPPCRYLIPGFSCQPQYYKTWIERLASWGSAVITYDRPLGGLFQPTAETELSYFEAIMGCVLCLSYAASVMHVQALFFCQPPVL